eukprot:403347103
MKQILAVILTMAVLLITSTLSRHHHHHRHHHDIDTGIEENQSEESQMGFIEAKNKGSNSAWEEYQRKKREADRQQKEIEDLIRKQNKARQDIIDNLNHHHHH